MRVEPHPSLYYLWPFLFALPWGRYHHKLCSWSHEDMDAMRLFKNGWGPTADEINQKLAQARQEL